MIDAVYSNKLKDLTDKQRDSLKNIIDNDIGNICKRESFINCRQKEFSDLIKNIIRQYYCNEQDMYRVLCNLIDRKAQTKHFGQFLSDLDMERTESDYDHVLKIHIIDAAKMNIVQSTFSFFQKAVNCEKLKDKCASCQRKKEREDDSEQTDVFGNIIKSVDKNLWTFKQIHNQSELDKIHSHLVHLDWKSFIHKNALYKNEDEGVISSRHR